MTGNNQTMAAFVAALEADGIEVCQPVLFLDDRRIPAYHSVDRL